jgi:uncharacterized protein
MLPIGIQLRRFKDVVAFRTEGQAPWAFHARNMELAEVSEETWESLSPAEFISAESEDLRIENEAAHEIRDWEASENPEVISEELKFGIKSLTINVTQICNLHCHYCAAGGDGTYGDAVKKISIEKTLPQIKFFLEQLKPGSAFHVSFLGGEPLLYPEAMRAIAEYTKSEAQAKNISATFKVTTNGTLLTDKNINILNQIGTNVVVSLDGPARINDARRPDKTGRGSTEKILLGLKKLSEQRTNVPSLEVHAVMDPEHCDVEATYYFFRHLPVDGFEFTFSVNDTNIPASRLFVESYERAAAQAYLFGGEKELRRFRLFDRYFTLLDNQERVENHCGLGKTLAVIDARNRMFNCPWTVGDSNNQIGNDRELHYDRLAKYGKSQVEMNKCQNCWARFLCGGGCSFVHGSVNGTDLDKKNDFCFRTRYLTALALKYFSLTRGTHGKEGEQDGQKETH